VIQAAGYTPVLLPVLGAGRTLISKGFIDQARQRAQQLLEAIERSDPQLTSPVVGVEPSEILSLRDEYRDLLPGDLRIAPLAQRAFMIDEFLIRPGVDGQKRLRTLNLPIDANVHKVILHGHCYQKAQPPAPDGFATGVGATVEMLKGAGFQVEVVDSGCCGMAGAFGYESEHYETSIKVGELGLLPALRQARSKDKNVLVAASGVSCQAQIEDGVGDAPHHPISLVYQRLRDT
jgi:Fe-S oxidoreductase